MGIPLLTNHSWAFQLTGVTRKKILFIGASFVGDRQVRTRETETLIQRKSNVTIDTRHLLPARRSVSYVEMRISRARSHTAKEKSDEFFTSIVNDRTLVRRLVTRSHRIVRLFTFSHSHDGFSSCFLSRSYKHRFQRRRCRARFQKVACRCISPGINALPFCFLPSFLGFSALRRILLLPLVIFTVIPTTDTNKVYTVIGEEEDWKHSSSSRITLPLLSGTFQHSLFLFRLISTTSKPITCTLSFDDSTTIPYFAPLSTLKVILPAVIL